MAQVTIYDKATNEQYVVDEQSLYESLADFYEMEASDVIADFAERAADFNKA